MAKDVVKAIEFLSQLDTRTLTDKSNRLLKDFVISIKGKLIVIPEGFETDFASVPRIPLFYTLVGGRGKKAAVVHDYLYASNFFNRKLCDDIFYDALRETGMGWFSANIMYTGVRLGGSSAYRTYTLRIEEQTKINEATHGR